MKITLISIIAVVVLCTVAVITIIAWFVYIRGRKKDSLMEIYDSAFDDILHLRAELRDSNNKKLKMSAVKLDSVIDILAGIEKVILEERDSGHENKVQ